MGTTPAESQLEAIAWMRELGKRFSLARPVYFVPGISNEDTKVWDKMFDWGAAQVAQWSTFARRIDFMHPAAASDFVDLGDATRAQIAADLGARNPPATSYDVVTYSMGGLDVFASLLGVSRDGFTPGPLPDGVHQIITLDTPFHGFPNWDLRRRFADMSDPAFPGRPTQCAAMNPASIVLNDLLNKRGALRGRCNKLTCFSAGGETDIQVPYWSSNLCSDQKPATLWGTTPAFDARLVDGTVHGGTFGVCNAEWVIASVFGLLLFDR